MALRVEAAHRAAHTPAAAVEHAGADHRRVHVLVAEHRRREALLEPSTTNRRGVDRTAWLPIDRATYGACLRRHG